MKVPQHIIDHLRYLTLAVGSQHYGKASVFLVGGAVRDMMLGKEPKDYDFVTDLHPDYMCNLGFEQVSKSFPVFHTGVGELACTRVERKSGAGYTGFTSTYTPSFKEDCLRRDITINAMLWHPDLGLVCPIERSSMDLQRKLIHPCSSAFGEDPLRVLRVARLASNLNFEVSDLTFDYMIPASRELHLLPADRVRSEIERARDLEEFIIVLNTDDQVAQEVHKWLPITHFRSRLGEVSADLKLVEFYSTIPQARRKDVLKQLGYGAYMASACNTFDRIRNFATPNVADFLLICKAIQRGSDLDWADCMSPELDQAVALYTSSLKGQIYPGMDITKIEEIQQSLAQHALFGV